MSFMSDARDEAGGFRVIASALTAVGRVGAACRAAADYEALQALSDEELAARGLVRDEICAEVLRRHLPD